MKVSIRDIEKKTGIFSKTTHPGVAFNVTFSPEEIQTIKKANLGDATLNSFYNVPERRERWERMPACVMWLVNYNGKDHELWFDNMVEARNFKEGVKEDLQGLKSAIDEFSQPSQPEQFEL